MILYLEDFSLFPEQTFRIWADISPEGLVLEKVEMCFRSGTVDVTDLLTDMERAKIRARAFEQASSEPDEMDLARDELIRRDEA